MTAEARDGIAAFWVRDAGEAGINPAALVERTLESARRLPIAAID
jgi:hypothetical protein